MAESLAGLVERVTYHNPENGFAVLKVKVKGRQDLVTVVGTVTSVTAGEHLEAQGQWVVARCGDGSRNVHSSPGHLAEADTPWFNRQGNILVPFLDDLPGHKVGQSD